MHERSIASHPCVYPSVACDASRSVLCAVLAPRGTVSPYRSAGVVYLYPFVVVPCGYEAKRKHHERQDVVVECEAPVGQLHVVHNVFDHHLPHKAHCIR
eukprot:scaffold8103_cov403-Prasinococcus_capsulatus_cf.AAC.6